MPASTYVLVVSRMGAVFGAGRTSFEAGLDAMARMARNMERDPNLELDMVAEDLQGVSMVTVSGDNAEALLHKLNVQVKRPPRARVAQGPQ